MPLTTAVLNIGVDAIADELLFVSLHTGAGPGSTGANEKAGVARKALALPAASSGATSVVVTFTGVPADTYTSYGTWTAASGGTFRGGAMLAANRTLNATGTLELTVNLTGENKP